MDRDQAAKIVAVLFSSYPQSKYDRDNAQAFVDGIVDLDAATCGAAVQRLIRTNRFLPSISEIREACSARKHGALRTGEEAYATLTEAVRRHGRDYGQGSPRFSDPLIARCIGIWGSWNDVCGSPSDDPGGRARFIELYDELASRHREDVSSGMPLPAPERARIGFQLPPQPEPAPRRVEATMG